MVTCACGSLSVAISTLRSHSLTTMPGMGEASFAGGVVAALDSMGCSWNMVAGEEASVSFYNVEAHDLPTLSMI